MAAISCPDCKNTVSDAADACPHCGRPSPGKSIAAINEENNNAVWGLIWIANAVIAFWKLGVGWGIASLFLGPFVWLFWLIL